eukprot:TRINITY_DN456_c0_g1_i2.p1 TRINITY_DN456_c0_g1~~TRINITY_DN456_c0_g1_i2.p1  ORF type:complete len:219 (-),score=-40.47 TRINITY_DN456_c0_g1_i2:203-859(-)
MPFKPIKLSNMCAFPVWPAITGAEDNAEAKKIMARPLQPGTTVTWPAGAFWGGSIWGRTGCRFDARGRGGCDSGDCGGAQCGLATANGGSLPSTFMTKADFEFLGGVAKPDTFYVSLERGLNIPMMVAPAQRPHDGACGAMGCGASAAEVCPRRFQKRHGARVTACAARFDGFDYGPFKAVAESFRRACPNAFPFRTAGVCPGGTSGYRLVFCPGRRN